MPIGRCSNAVPLSLTVSPALMIRFFSTTPQDLLLEGLYKALAYAYYPGQFRPVSVGLIALALGAVDARSGLKNLPAKLLPAQQLRRLSKEAKAQTVLTVNATLPKTKAKAEMAV